MNDRIMAVLKGVIPNMSDDIDVDLLESGLIDSFEIFEIVMGIEEEFDIEIDPDLIVPENFRSVRDITSMMEKLMN